MGRSNYEKKYDAIFRRKRKRRENCAKTELESPSNDQFQQQIIQNDVKKNSEARYSTPGIYMGIGLVTALMTLHWCWWQYIIDVDQSSTWAHSSSLMLLAYFYRFIISSLTLVYPWFTFEITWSKKSKMKIKNQITMESKMESFQRLNSVMWILHHLIEQRKVLIPTACTMEAIDINNNSKLPKVRKNKNFVFWNILKIIKL